MLGHKEVRVGAATLRRSVVNTLEPSLQGHNIRQIVRAACITQRGNVHSISYSPADCVSLHSYKQMLLACLHGSG